MKNRIKDLLALYQRCRLSRSAAGLSYYLLLALFPMLVCVSILLTQFRLRESDILRMIAESINTDLRTLFPMAWENPDRLSAAAIFMIATTLLLSASAGAFRCLSQTAEDIFDTAFPGRYIKESGRHRSRGIFRGVLHYLFATLLFFAVYLSIFIMVLWQELIALLSRPSIPEAIPEILSELRFLLLFLLFFSICYYLQYCVRPISVSWKQLLPGAVFCAVGMGGAAVYFSLFIRGSAEYSLIYGSLASLMLLLTWVYFCGNLVLLGVAVNCVFMRNK